MATVKVYSTPTCPWCHKVKAYLNSKKVDYEDLNVAVNTKAREEMVSKSGQMGVPVVDINGKIIIGFDQEEIDSTLNLK
jgi:glutaredoxin-like YruB-family protein